MNDLNIKRSHKILGYFLLIVLLPIVTCQCQREHRRQLYVEQIPMYVTIENDYFAVQGQRRVKVYFSRGSSSFQDYIEYKSIMDLGPDIYYLPPNRIYVVDSDQDVIVHSNKYDIHYIYDYTSDFSDSINWLMREYEEDEPAQYKIAMKDSAFLRDYQYSFLVYGNTLEVLDKEQNTVFDSENR